MTKIVGVVFDDSEDEPYTLTIGRIGADVFHFVMSATDSVDGTQSVCSVSKNDLLKALQLLLPELPQ